MAVEKPTEEEYFRENGEALALPTAREYDLLVRSIRNSLNAPEGGMSEIIAHMKSASAIYRPPELLFVSNIDDIALIAKPYESLLNKIYRKNALTNDDWPEEPKNRIVNGSNYISRINDILRARIICKYMDGPKIVCEVLKRAYKKDGYYYPMATPDGYYSWHFYMKKTEELPDREGARSIGFRIELQFVTQLAEALNKLTHGIYEGQRTLDANIGEEWQWSPEDPKFRATFAGHSIHLLEGILLEMKQRQFERDEVDG